MHFSKRISLLAICTLIAGTPYASFGAAPTGDKTVTSKSYVTTQLGLKQDKSTAVKYNGSTAVGSETKGVYVNADGTVSAMTHAVNVDVPANAEFTDTTYSFDTGANNGTIKVTPEGGTAQNVAVKGWSTKEDTSNKLAQGNATTSVIADNVTNDTKFPTVKAVADYVTGQGYITNAAIPTKLSQFTDDIDAKNTINNVKLNGGNALPVTNKTVDIPLMGAASASGAGSTGLVPAPAKGDQGKVLSGAGTWIAQPTVNNATLTVQKNGTSVGTFTANASSDKTINVTVPTTVSELTDSANYELVSNKLQQGSSSSAVITNSSSDTQYPSAKAVYKVVSAKENSSNKLQQGTTSTTPVITSSSTDTQYPSAKAVYTALNAQSTSAGNTYQPKSTAAYQMGKAGGGWETMSAAQQNALNSGITSTTKVTHTASTAVGSETKGVYVNADGTVSAMTHAVNVDVPANAEFTDTTYTFATGSSDGTISVTPEGGSAQSVTVKNVQTTTNLVKQGTATGSVLSNTSSDTKYPSALAVYNAITNATAASNGTYQAKATANYKVSKSDGTWNDLGTTLDTSATGYVATNAVTAGTIATALAGKQNTLTAGANIQINGDTISATDTTYSVFTTSANGLVPKASASGDTNKFLKGNGTWATPANSITTVANSDGTAGAGTAADGSIKVTKDGTTTYPVVQGWANKQNKLTAGANIQINGDTISATDTTYSVFTGANGTTAGTAGLVKAPAATDNTKFLKGDGTWGTPTDNDTTYSADNVTIQKSSSNQFSAKTAAVANGGTALTTGDQVYDFVTTQGYITNAAVPTKLSQLTDDIDAANKINNVKLNGGNALPVTNKTVDIPLMGAASSGAAGSVGLVPAPSAGAQNKVLSGAGTWVAQPTVNNATLTVQKNGTSVGTFTANASSDKTINVTVPTTVSELTDSANYELVSNKAKQGTTTGSIFTADSTDTEYPSAKAVYTALNAQSTSAGNTYQPKSTAAYQMGKAGGGWQTMTDAQQNALNSGITSTKVTNYDNHLADTTVHITAAERTAWNAKENSSNKLAQGSATTSVIADNSTDDTKFPTVKAVYTALNAQSTSAGNTYQPKSTAAYQMGKAGGGWETMSAAQQNALNSGITSTKVGNYDTHIADTTKHITAAERTAWNAKENSSNKLAQGSATTSVIADNSTDDTKFPTVKAVYTALNAQSTSAGNTYQPKSTAAYQMGKAGGGWETMSAAQQNALNSGITSTNKVTHSGAVGSGIKGVYVDANGAVTAMSYSLGKDVPSTAELTDTTYTFGTGTTSGAFTVTPEGGSAQTVSIYGWSTKENSSNKLAQGNATTSVIADNSTDDTKFPTVKAVADYVTGQGYITSAALPTVNDATLTIQKNGTTIDTFTANSATNKTINIQADKNVIETVKANGTALTVDSNKAVNIPLMGAASSGAAGSVGLVPAPAKGDQEKVLSGAKTWVVNSTTAVTNSDGSTVATSTSANDGSIKVTKDGTTTYPVVRGWSTKENSSNKLAQGSATTSVIADNATNDTKFPTVKAVADYVTGQGYITSAALPTVNDATLTVQLNGTSKGTFTANAASNKTININGVQTTANLLAQGSSTGSVLSSTSSDSKYPSAKAVYYAITNATAASNGTYQAKATANYKVSKSDGTWNDLGTTLDTSATGYVADNAVTAGTIATALAGKQNTLTAGANIQINGDTISATDTTYSVFTTSANGLVPKASASGDTNKFLKGNGTWATPANSITTVTNSDGTAGASTAANGSIKVDKDGTVTYPVVKGWSTKQDKLTAGSNITINGSTISATDTTYSVFTTSANGLVPKASASGDTGKFLKGDGTWGTPTDTTYNDFTGADGTAAGAHGLVPAPAATDNTKFLKGDGTWGTPTDTNTTYTASNGVTLTGTNFTNSGVRSVATGTGNDGTISVNTNGESANVAVKGWDNKQTKPSSVSNGKVLTYTGANANNNVSAKYIQVPVANNAPNGGSATVSTLADIWVE